MYARAKYILSQLNHVQLSRMKFNYFLSVLDIWSKSMLFS